MNRIHAGWKIALVAATLSSGAAFAADDSKKVTTNKGDAAQVMPSRDDLKPGAAPTVPRMDDNAQRQHDRNTRSAAPAGTGTTTGAAPSGTAAADVRDWATIDKNNDHLIGPDEMEAYLKAEWSKSAPQTPSQPKS
jgi:hypothetical protein